MDEQHDLEPINYLAARQEQEPCEVVVVSRVDTSRTRLPAMELVLGAQAGKFPVAPHADQVGPAADRVPGTPSPRVTKLDVAGWRALRRGMALGLVTVLVSFALNACGSSPGMAPGTALVVSAPVRIAHTRLGTVGYRVVGSGPPLVLIMGYGWTMEGWDPRLIHALARHNRVVMFDNAGVGRTKPLPGELTATLTIDAMADQTSALIDTLGLGRPDVLGWSMGGMIAQALAVLHPAQVRRLVLCATYPGNGAVAVPSQAARQSGNDFPANQASAYDAFKAAIAEYPAAPAPPTATKTVQAGAVSDWWDGTDAAGRKIARISVPTLIADGTDDQLDPVANDHALARLIPRASLVLYPDAGHGFLFQDGTRFASLIESFLTGHPSS